MTAVEVLKVRPIGRGQLRAVADVLIGPVKIIGIKILQPDDGQAWVALPQVPIRAKGTGWVPCVTIEDPTVLADLRRLVLDAWGGES